MTTDDLRTTKFIITCSSRTGSTMLVHLLRSHPDIMSYGEIYSMPQPRGFAGRYVEQINDPKYLATLTADRDRDQIEFLYKVAFDAQGRKVAGFKFKYGQLDNPLFSQLTAQLIRDTDIKIIHLCRHNLLARYLSQYIANNVTGFTMRLKEEELSEVPPVTLDPEVCHRDFDKATNQQAKYTKLFANHSVFDVCYEDLLAEPARSQATAKMLSFLGVADAPLHSPTQKLAQKPLHESIKNYSQLQEHFSGTPYATLFDLT